MIKDHLPFLKTLTTLENNLDNTTDELETINFLESLNYISSYLVINDFLVSLIEYFNICEDDIKIGEGFISKELKDKFELEITNEKVTEFKSVLFSVPDCIFSISIIEKIILNMKYYKDNIVSIEVDTNSGWTQIIVSDEEIEFETKILIRS